MKPLILLVVLLTFLVGVTLHVDPTGAQVYKKRNADGSVTYSDKPIAGAEQLQIEPLPVTEFAKPEAAATGTSGSDSVPSNEQGPMATENFSVAITAPTQKQQIRANNGEFDVVWQSQPEFLPDGYNYELIVDGNSAWLGNNSNQITLAGMDRGERRLYLRIVDVQGRQVARSDTLVVYVMRASVANPTTGTNGGGA